MIDTERAVKLIQSLSWAVSRYGVISPMMDEECREIIAMLRQSGEDEVQRKARERQSGARLAQWPPDGIDISRPEDE